MPSSAVTTLRQPDESGFSEPISPRVRKAFAALEIVAPGVGGRWAADLWCTPPPVEPNVRHVPGLQPGEPISATWSGFPIAAESWGDGEPVYLVHGWGGWRGHLGMYVKPLVQAGYRVIAFDLPSHNESGSGWLRPGRTTADECAQAVEAMVRTFGPARAIVAHSLGATATILAASRGTAVERIVMLAPMGDFEMYVELFAKRHGFGPRTTERMRRRLAAILGFPLLHANPSYAASTIDEPPALLVIHDPDDPASPHEASENLVGQWPGATLRTTSGLGRLAHYRLLRHRPAIQAGVEFIVR